jgi:hypothetical protein
MDLVDVWMLEDDHRPYLRVREETWTTSVPELVNQTQLAQRRILPKITIPFLPVHEVNCIQTRSEN